MPPNATQRPFENDVIDRLARIEERIADYAKLSSRVSALESQRTYLAGFVAAATALAGYLHLKV